MIKSRFVIITFQLLIYNLGIFLCLSLSKYFNITSNLLLIFSFNLCFFCYILLFVYSNKRKKYNNIKPSFFVFVFLSVFTMLITFYTYKFFFHIEEFNVGKIDPYSSSY